VIVADYDILVDPSYHQFALHDPTCEESPNFEVAIPAASRDVVGWAPNTVAVQVVTLQVPKTPSMGRDLPILGCS
jgi:hypothetical protein